MGKERFNLGVYMFAAGMGLLSGLMLSKAAYHKGKADACEECSELLREAVDKVNEELDKKEEEEA